MSFVNGIQISTTSSSVAVAASFSPTKNTVVGLDQDLMELMDRLRGQESKLEIIPILGMGGIGLQRFPQSSRSRLLQPSASAFPTSPKFVGDYERVAPSDVDALPQFPPAHLTHVAGLPRLRFVTAFPSSSASPFGLCLPLIRAPTAAV
ncbi:uncharacterized protein LOC130991744 [Salvia miltiorrhiza]|uniref:uncharacterized protein LOC130991744 n=1 Tax=Salvia miltiorrhiza TaxID=226208 RepID=UPI0025ABFF19|nr:uncharacterized protein LOC130991744 [Salvia miltiorrhiza]